MFVKKEHVWKLLKWVDNITEQHKKVTINCNFNLFQGLRVIKTIIEIKGAKRFKMPMNQQATLLSERSEIDPATFDYKLAKEKLRKMTQQTSYRNQFGEPPKAAEDYVVLK